MTRDFSAWRTERQRRVNLHLAIDLENKVTEFSFDTAPYLSNLYQACNYATLRGGKRFRPLLCYAAAEAVGSEPDIALDTVAASIELIHAYSLVHDDLPAMDNDDLRRGQPTCHKAFDEATAILVGDALQCRAFELLTVIDAYSAATRLELIAALTAAAGPRGMVGGQAIDIAAVNTTVTQQYLESMHTLKTGALIIAALKMGGMAVGADLNQLDALSRFGTAIGLAFQVQDDILDVNSDSETLGKTQGADLARNKPTYVSLLGMAGAKAKAEELYQDAVQALEGMGDTAWALRTLAEQVVTRGS
ncbi:MAG: geranylgeranyl diphosphate synthase type II [Halieaceae bacterium]|jgi:geranylgeranyl diphosphate synthase type II